jgi:phosphate/sulfate permease
MLTVTIAFVVATALFLVFKQTRWIGVVGVFILLCLSPLVFGAVALLAALIVYLAVRQPRYELIPRGQLPTDARTRRRNGVLLLAALAIGGALALGYSEPTSENAVSKIVGAVRAAPRSEVIVLRTPGGLLEVSRIETTEMLDTTIQHEIFGVKIGETMPRIRVPAVYRYVIELEPEWRVVRADDVFTIVAPRIRPSLPVAVDFAGIQKDVAGSWMLLPFTGNDDLELLERSITTRLEQKARSRDYIDRQREDARETVREFARKWLVEQTRWKRADYEDIRVLFADEPAGAIAPLTG